MTKTASKPEQEDKRLFGVSKRLASLLAIVLAGCGSNPGPSGQPLPAAPSTPENPNRPLEALVYETAESPFLDVLVERGEITLTSFDGSQKPEQFDAVVFDGDAHEPASLSEHEGVIGSFRAGRSVLMVDADTEHKNALGERLGFASKRPSVGYLASLGEDAYGRPFVALFDFADSQPALEAAAFSQALADRAALSTQQVGEDPPAEAIYKLFYYNASTSMAPNGVQKGSFSNATVLRLYYNDGQTSDRTFQWLESNVDIFSTPANDGKLTANTSSAKGWFQDEITFSTVPCQAGDCSQPDARFTTVASSPTNTNNSTAVTSSVAFSVNTDGPTFTAGSSKTTTIKDWTIVNQSPSDTPLTAWDDYSSNPYNPKSFPSNAPYSCESTLNCPFTNSLLRLEVPAILSTSQFQGNFKSVWQTDAVLTDTVEVSQATEVTLAYVKCPIVIFGACTLAYDDDVVGQRQGFTSTQSLAVNMGAVVPIPIESVTFSLDTVAAGQKVTGTVTLAREAYADYDLTLASNSGNATFLPDLVIKKGEASATFAISTNANGLGSQPVTVTVTATSQFYNNAAQGQLTVTP